MTSCCLSCQTPSTIDAHIIPRAVVREFRRRGPDKKTLAVFSDRAVVARAQNGIFDPNILCQTCDGKIGNADKWFVEHLEEFHRAARGRQNYETVTLAISPRAAIQFAVSVIYRASLSQLELFRDISLGPYTERAKDIALSTKQAKFEEPIVLINVMASKEVDARQFVFYPVRCQSENGQHFVFVAAGIQFLVKFGGKGNGTSASSGMMRSLRLRPDADVLACICPFEESAEAQFLIQSSRTKIRF